MKKQKPDKNMEYKKVVLEELKKHGSLSKTAIGAALATNMYKTEEVMVELEQEGKVQRDKIMLGNYNQRIYTIWSLKK